MKRRWVVGVVAGLALAGCTGLIEIQPDGGEEGPPPNADPQAGCSLGCHGDANNAPPQDLSGGTATSSEGVGAHQAHLDPASAWHRPVACADCHDVPAEVGSPGHMDDGDNTAELTFSSIAGGGDASWSGGACTTACHGSAALGGTAPEPVWTQVDGTQSTCGSCHGAPPPAPHPDDDNCASCHPTMEEGSLTFRDPLRHIDGVVDVISGVAGCTSCHGSADSSAPPTDLDGETARTSPGVGAHQIHLAASDWRHEITCSNCHLVPIDVDSPGHRDGDNVAELPFDALNPTATYTPATTTCANLYCHGNGRASNGTESWLTVGPMACGDCHSIDGTNMSGRHRKHIDDENMECTECHQSVVDGDMQIIAADLHVNGVHEIEMVDGTWDAANRTCSNTGCHGREDW